MSYCGKRLNYIFIYRAAMLGMGLGEDKRRLLKRETLLIRRASVHYRTQFTRHSEFLLHIEELFQKLNESVFL